MYIFKASPSPLEREVGMHLSQNENNLATLKNNDKIMGFKLETFIIVIICMLQISIFKNALFTYMFPFEMEILKVWIMNENV